MRIFVRILYDTLWGYSLPLDLILSGKPDMGYTTRSQFSWTLMIRNFRYILFRHTKRQRIFQLSTHHLCKELVGIFLILLEQIQGRQSMKMSTRRSWKNTKRQNTEDIAQMTGRHFFGIHVCPTGLFFLDIFRDNSCWFLTGCW